MRHVLLLLLLLTPNCWALQPTGVDVTTDPGVTVRVTPRAGNTSKNIDITVNRQDTVRQNGKQVYPALPVPPVVPPVPVTPPSDHTMHGAGVFVDPDMTKWPKATMTGVAVEMPRMTWVDPNGPWVLGNFPIPPAREVPNSGDIRNIAGFVGFNRLDPIVYPGQDGMAHTHELFGLASLTKDTTGQNIRQGCISTSRGGTWICSAYWLPAIIDTASHLPVKTPTLLVYYKSGPAGWMGRILNGVREGDTIKTWPDGLVIIAGDAKSTGPQVGVVRYNCLKPDANDADGFHGLDMMPDKCPYPGYFSMQVNFPQCWDGVHLDSANHKSHMAYTVNDTPGAPPGFAFSCPSTHPKLLPQVTLIRRTPLPLPGPDGMSDISKWVLSSDVYAVDDAGNVLAGAVRGGSGHGDWMEGVDPAVKRDWQTGCYDRKADCGSYERGNGLGAAEFGDN
jgi:hypothetical protein